MIVNAKVCTVWFHHFDSIKSGAKSQHHSEGNPFHLRILPTIMPWCSTTGAQACQPEEVKARVTCSRMYIISKMSFFFYQTS